MKPKFRTLRQKFHSLMDSKIVHLDGIRVDARNEVVGHDVRQEIIRGTYEFAERRLLRQILRPTDCVVEIGAGIGSISLLASRLVGAENVTSFEANPDLEKVIRANYDLNDLHPNLNMKAVTLDGGPVSFFVTENLLSSSVYERRGKVKVEVESVSINEVISAQNPTVLVLDVEGAETDLLPKANLDGVRVLLVELHPHVVGQLAIENLEESLRSKGFKTIARQHKNIWIERR